MEQTFISSSSRQTQALGKAMAKKILKEGPQKRAVVLALQGDLGGGKTTFVQGFAKGLGVKEKITSPTFVLMKKFRIRVNSCSYSCPFVYLYHIDCYRIQGPKEILVLGFKEIIADPQNIVAVEWAERIKAVLPKNCPTMKFDFVDKTKRKVTFKNFQLTS